MSTNQRRKWGSAPLASRETEIKGIAEYMREKGYIMPEDEGDIINEIERG